MLIYKLTKLTASLTPNLGLVNSHLKLLPEILNYQLKMHNHEQNKKKLIHSPHLTYTVWRVTELNSASFSEPLKK